MNTVIIDKTRGIRHLEFQLPTKPGMYLLVGPNGMGKTTLLTALHSIGDRKAFRSFSNSGLENVDQYDDSRLTYRTEKKSVTYKKGPSGRWVPTPKAAALRCRDFGYSATLFIKADTSRFSVPQEEIRKGDYLDVDASIRDKMNELLNTQKFDNLKRLKIPNGKGRHSTYFYVIELGKGQYFSEKHFSTGERALLRLVVQLAEAQKKSLVLLDEAELALHPHAQRKLLEYLKGISKEKQLTIIVSTHSATMIRETVPNQILLVEEQNEPGALELVTPCYPTRAIGFVDSPGYTEPDAIFFVEDNMGRFLLKQAVEKHYERMGRKLEIVPEIWYLPVGGYLQTLKMARETGKLYRNCRVRAVLDHDVFDDPEHPESQAEKEKILKEYEDVAFDLGCTPENAIVDGFLSGNRDLEKNIRMEYNCSLNELVKEAGKKTEKARGSRSWAKDIWKSVLKGIADCHSDSEEIIIRKLVSEVYPLIEEKYGFKGCIGRLTSNLKRQ